MPKKEEERRKNTVQYPIANFAFFWGRGVHRHGSQAPSEVSKVTVNLDLPGPQGSLWKPTTSESAWVILSERSLFKTTETEGNGRK